MEYKHTCMTCNYSFKNKKYNNKCPKCKSKHVSIKDIWYMLSFICIYCLNRKGCKTKYKSIHLKISKYQEPRIQCEDFSLQDNRLQKYPNPNLKS